MKIVVDVGQRADCQLNEMSEDQLSKISDAEVDDAVITNHILNETDSA